MALHAGVAAAASGAGTEHCRVAVWSLPEAPTPVMERLRMSSSRPAGRVDAADSEGIDDKPYERLGVPVLPPPPPLLSWPTLLLPEPRLNDGMLSRPLAVRSLSG